VTRVSVGKVENFIEMETRRGCRESEEKVVRRMILCPIAYEKVHTSSSCDSKKQVFDEPKVSTGFLLQTQGAAGTTDTSLLAMQGLNEPLTVWF
jgi:hypothetical protein